MDAACLAQVQMICPVGREYIAEKSRLRRQFVPPALPDSEKDSLNHED
jgi:hypothetical protein